ncbi:SusC/RagA family TonB-linked outer membrane protein [Flavobacterium sp.]|uniref:SusC/RagA family TonB-linked outer membrane protein n=1 Tax=Flavobacterium sp. TaxID=239 RepID=UPI0025CEC808|nr:SusC/RagA family TonB-linked outer membrane protein [Flavobacterium sp.]
MKTIYKKLLFLFLLLPLSILAQNTLSGVVVDKKTNQPLPGVNVTVQGASKGTSTDFDGKFMLAGLKNGDKVVFSFVGYDNDTVSFSGQKSVSISLNETSNQLQEVVVQVGYGTVKKKDATGSVSLLTAKDFNKGANVTAENLLNGRVAGLTINTSGAPGSGSEIRIRGGASLFASNDPLIVIDGLPIDNTTGTGATSILSSINPSTIESFSVLKDASATAIYGSRASNGVILITTKKGGKKLAIDYNFQYGSGKLVKTLNVFNGDEFRALITQKRPTDVPQLGTSNTNWQEAIYRRTDFVDNNLSIRGNLFNAIPSRITIGNTYQEGLRLTNKFNRNSVSVALNPSVFKDHLKMRINANYSNELNRFTDGVEGAAIKFDPTQPIYDATSVYGGFFEYQNSGNQIKPQTIRNPVAQLLQTFDTGINNRFYGNFEVDYKLHFFPALRAVVNVGFDQANGTRSKYASRFAASSGSNNNIPYGTDEYTESVRRNKLLDAYFVYNKTFGKTVFDLTGGYSYQKFEASKFLTGNINDPNLPGGPTGFPKNDIDTDVVLVGFFARTNFNYNDKYLLTVSYRRDGSSRFSQENRWGNFPSVAFAWKIKSDFFKGSKAISDLKVRVGWGITGQQNIAAANDYLQKINLGSGSSQYIFGPSPTPIAISNRLSPLLKWEETATYNVGFDYGIFSRVNGSVDVFYKESKDLLVDAAVPDGTNFANRAYQNVGSFTTKGIEFSINADVVKTDNFNWNLNFNVTSYQRKITKLIYNADILAGDNILATGTQAQIYSEGFAPNSFYLYKQLYNTAGQPIEGAYADLNGDGIINSKDKYIYKNADPKATFGLASTMNFRNLDFSFNLRASVGNHIFNAFEAKNAQYDQLSTGGALANIPTSVLDTNFSIRDNVALSDRYVENASFLRMDNVTLGYTFPKWLDGKATLRLFTGVQNVFVITKYTGIDPEITNNGVDNTIYPRQRSFLFGANVKF